MLGTPDSRLAEVCRGEDRILVTLDLDFANIRSYPPATYPGLIVLRPANQAVPTILTAVSRLVPMLECEPIDARLWVVTDSKIRISGPQS
jgi:predicted nuclease of predicted toxin-antitoxin system